MTQRRRSEKQKMRAMVEAVPTTWLDPLLTGPAAVVGKPPYSCPDIEALFIALRKRLQEIANA